MMIRRLRFISGILALVATAFFLGEGLWAAACAPMGMNAEATFAVPDGAGAPAASEHAPSHDPGSGDDEGAGCPFTAVASSGGCASAALSAASVQALVVAPRLTKSVSLFESRPDLLLASSLFRPPRA